MFACHLSVSLQCHYVPFCLFFALLIVKQFRCMVFGNGSSKRVFEEILLSNMHILLKTSPSEWNALYGNCLRTVPFCFLLLCWVGSSSGVRRKTFLGRVVCCRLPKRRKIKRNNSSNEIFHFKSFEIGYRQSTRLKMMEMYQQID